MNLLDSYITLHDFPRLTVDVGGVAIAGKRNDALALAFGGNKVCKLRMLLTDDALAKGVDTVLITSVLQSNFMRLIAAVCCQPSLNVTFA